MMVHIDTGAHLCIMYYIMRIALIFCGSKETEAKKKNNK